jgi:hypothetical protein
VLQALPNRSLTMPAMPQTASAATLSITGAGGRRTPAAILFSWLWMLKISEPLDGYRAQLTVESDKFFAAGDIEL